jgi:hypothetical protein
LRRDLIKAIPRVPNDKASLQHVEAKNLADLLIDYINWRSRYVGERPRTVSIEPAAQADPRWSARAAAINAFLDKVARGDDLTPSRTLGDTPLPRARPALRRMIGGPIKTSS